MINKFKKTISNFIKSEKNVPLLAGFVSGFYPFVFYFSNNFSATSSIKHFSYFVLLFLIAPMVFSGGVFYLFKKSKFLSSYKTHFLFVFIIITTLLLLYNFSALSTQLSFKKKAFVFFLVGVMILFTTKLSVKHHKAYKKLIVLILIVSTLPIFKLSVTFLEHLKPDSWMLQLDDIESVVFVNKPNIYLIQPDGYVSETTMKNEPYNYNSQIYNWLKNKGFKVYDDFKSNYPATLVSNSSMFGMKQHKYNNMLFPDIEMTNARRVISGNNTAIRVFKNNKYKTFSLASDEYFLQNNPQPLYDYSNIGLHEIPLFSTGDNVPKDVFKDLKALLKNKVATPGFYFIEKLEPHHVYIEDAKNELERERKWHLERVEKANLFIKETIEYIENKDSNSIIIVLADHGGFVGIDTYKEMYSNNDLEMVHSTFSVLAAIKWNGYLKNEFDKDLRSNVNLFRVLFSVLSEDSKYLKHLEDNGAYNLNYENPYYNSVYKVIDDKGDMLLKPPNKK